MSHFVCSDFQEKKPPILTDRKKALEERAGKNDKFAALKAKRENKIQKGGFS